MRRREFIGLVGSAAAWPLAAHAQQSGKLPTIGYVGSAPKALAREQQEEDRARARPERL